MKQLIHRLILSIIVTVAVLSFTACDYNSVLLSDTPTETPYNTEAPNPTEQPESRIMLKIIIGDSTFSASLYDNDTASALAEMLPVTLDMNELNGNEKYYYFDTNLPSSAQKPSQIQTGDIMLYGKSCLVLFYKSFSTSYSYTPIGRIEYTEGLAEALGSGDVRITFELE